MKSSRPWTGSAGVAAAAGGGGAEGSDSSACRDAVPPSPRHPTILRVK